MLYVLRSSDDESRFVNRVLTFLAVLTLIACGIGFVVYVTQPVARFTGSFFDPRFTTDYWPNAWAEYLLLIWPAFAYLLRKIRKMTSWVIGSALLGFMIGCLFLSYSRGGVLVFFGQLGLLALIYLWSYRDDMVREWNQMLRSGALVVMIAVVTFMGANALRSHFHDVQSVTEKVTFSAAEGASSVTERMDFWKESLQLSMIHPIVGWGPYSFRFIQPRLQDRILETSDHSHNVFLKYAVERGIPAAIFLIAILFLIWGTAWRLMVSIYWIEKRHSSDIDWLPFLLVSTVGVTVHNLIDYNLQFLGIALPFTLFLTFLALPKLRTLPKVPPPTERLAGKVELLLATAFLVIALVEGRLLILSSFGRHEEASGNDARALYFYNKSSDALFSRDLLLSRTQLLIKKELFTEAHNSIDHALEQNPEDARAWRLQGDIAMQQKRYDAALKSYERAYNLNHFNDLGITRSYVEAALQVNPDLVTLQKKTIDELLTRFSRAILENTHFIALSTNVEELARLTEILEKRYPNDAKTYRTMREDARKHAEFERAQSEARQPGLLW
jgi:O-antigen ligase